MIDHLLGRPSPSWKRLQVFLVVFFWVWRILYGNPGGPRILWIRRINRTLKQFTPWQLIVSTLTGVYAMRNLDKILGLGSPEPLANLYSRSYYRATWITTGLDAGFATAMSIQPKWLRDICSVLFSVYYIIYANEADEKLRRFRAVPTVEMLRMTWEKTTNPYIRALTSRPKISIRKKLLLPRPRDSSYERPVTAWLFFAPPAHQLSQATELILDFPGGGFISMTPEHHEDRLRMWALRTGKPVLSIDYGKAPEYPYPFAIDECFDVYRTLVESSGLLIGLSGKRLDVILTGDSAGAHIAVGVMIKILETQLSVPPPLALQLNYAALDFNFTSWMSPANLRVLQSEQSSGHITGLVEQKDHFGHISPLSMVGDRKKIRRRRSWREALRNLTSPVSERPKLSPRTSVPHLKSSKTGRHRQLSAPPPEEAGNIADEEEGPNLHNVPEEDKPLAARVRFHPSIQHVEPEPLGDSTVSPEGTMQQTPVEQPPLGTRLTMTSRTGYFQDRVISPSMMRAMAILYIGPHRNPDFASDYHISPILAPGHLLAQFPPLLMTCGEKDPFVDDTVIFAGRVRDAKRSRRRELEAVVLGKGTKYGEHLRMTANDDTSMRDLKREYNALASNSEEDWVRMQIYSEWSHGYLQMGTLMHEAQTVVDDLADWMSGVFTSNRDRQHAATSARSKRGYENASAFTREDEGSTSFASETELETDDMLIFAPKKRSPPPSLNGAVKPASYGRPESRIQPTTWANCVVDIPEKAAGRKDGLIAIQTTTTTPLSIPQDILHSPGFIDSSRLETDRTPPPQQKAALSSSVPTTKGSSAAKAGQTITESELMRRRRLLDSHLITSNDLVK